MKMRIAAAGNATAPLCKAAAGDVGEHLTICKPQAQQEFSVNLSSRRSRLETAREHLATAKPQAQAELSVNLSSRRSRLETAREHLATAKPQAQAATQS